MGWRARASTCCAATARHRRPGPGRASATRVHTTEHIVIATGSDPVIPPVPGLRELDGVWTNREATGDHRGAAAAAGARRRPGRASSWPRRCARMGALGGAGRGHGAPAAPRAAAARRGARRGARAPTASSSTSASRSAARPRGRASTCSSSPTAPSCAATACWSPPAAARASRGSGSRRSGSSRAARGIEVDARMRAGDGVWAIGDVTGIWPLTYVGKYQGRIAAANILGEPREADYAAVPARGVHRPPGRGGRVRPRAAHAPRRQLAEVPSTATYTRAYDAKPGFMTLVSDGERLTGAYAVGPEAGEWLQQATRRDPRARAAGGPATTSSSRSRRSRRSSCTRSELGAKVPAPA